jgi:hypothetical protein
MSDWKESSESKESGLSKDQMDMKAIEERMKGRLSLPPETEDAIVKIREVPMSERLDEVAKNMKALKDFGGPVDGGKTLRFKDANDNTVDLPIRKDNKDEG